jgi:putative DNA primase/helicase
MHVLGVDYAMQAMPDLLLVQRGDRHPTELADLFGKRLVVCQEAGQDRRLNEPLVKWLTGGDRVRARRMKEDFWKFRPTHKMVLVTNQRPEVRGTDEGIWRRLRLIPFTVRFPPGRQDKTLPEKLRQEAPGILAWLVSGCLEWQAHGMEPPDEVLHATQEYREAEEDLVGVFLAERCETTTDFADKNFRCSARVLWNHLREWCEANHEEMPSRKKFGAAMTNRGFPRYTNAGVWYRGVRPRGVKPRND